MTGRFENSKPLVNWISVREVQFNSDYSAVIFELEADYITEVDLEFTFITHFLYLNNKGISELNHSEKNILLNKNSVTWEVEIPFELLPDCSLTVESFKWGKSALDITTENFHYKSIAHSGVGIE